MTMTELLDRGRRAYDRQAWGEAYAALTEVATRPDVDPADLERRAIAAHMLGNQADATACWEDAHRRAEAVGDIGLAVRSAFHLAFSAFFHGDMARGGGWLARATTILEEDGSDRVERGWLLVPVAIRALDEGDARGALERFEAAAAIALRFGDRDLETMTRLGRGRSLMGLGELERGLAFLDEAMIAVTTDAISPIVVGQVYCGVIEACQEIFDVGRAQEWTAALDAWCARQAGSVPYRGRCLVFRAELLTFHGAWAAADDEARKAYEWLLGPPPEPAVGEARYRQAELHRLRGELDQAEAAYRDAAEANQRAEPGLALVRLAQGHADRAAATIGRALDEAVDPIQRARLLGPLVEIALARRDVATARAAADELAAIGGRAAPPFLSSLAAWADGSVRLAADDPTGALPALRRAAAGWQDLEAPYELARTRELIGRACSVLGDHDTAAIEVAAARRAYEELGAALDVERLDRAAAAAGRRTPDGPLSEREIEVLRLVAAGRTNREVAAALTISERTVDRHVSNIFTKLDVSSRAAATAWAYEHGLV
jgi:DNA-binding CsgD family transcriptional regulator